MFAAANFWASCIDLAPGYSASFSALMNTMGSIGGVVSSTVTASIAVHRGWVPALDVAVWVTIGSGLLFTMVNANHSIGENGITQQRQHPQPAVVTSPSPQQPGRLSPGMPGDPTQRE